MVDTFCKRSQKRLKGSSLTSPLLGERLRQLATRTRGHKGQRHAIYEMRYKIYETIGYLLLLFHWLRKWTSIVYCAKTRVPAFPVLILLMFILPLTLELSSPFVLPRFSPCSIFGD